MNWMVNLFRVPLWLTNTPWENGISLRLSSLVIWRSAVQTTAAATYLLLLLRILHNWWPRRDETRSSASDESMQLLRSLWFSCSTCKNYYYQSFPPSSSLFLLSWRSVLSALPIQAVAPSLCRGEVCDGCNLNFQPRLSVNWWSLAVWWNNRLFLVIWRLAVQTRRRQPTYYYYYASFTMQ
jgi:hypothetical protein